MVFKCGNPVVCLSEKGVYLYMYATTFLSSQSAPFIAHSESQMKCKQLSSKFGNLRYQSDEQLGQ